MNKIYIPATQTGRLTRELESFLGRSEALEKPPFGKNVLPTVGKRLRDFQRLLRKPLIVPVFLFNQISFR